MTLTQEQFDRISHVLPVQRGNVEIDNLTLLNALLYILENGCKWRALPEHFGKWYTIYKRINRWVKKGILQKIFEVLQKERLLLINVEFIALDSTCFKVHPDAHGALKKPESNLLERPKAGGTPNFIWLPQMIKLP
jgi:transposase